MLAGPNRPDLLRSENEVLRVRESDRVYQGFSVAFDMSFEEIWISYLVGATLWLAPKALAADPESLPMALTAAGVTVLHAVPTLLALFAVDVPNLRLVNLGGEICPEALVARWAVGGRQVFNTYGPTEATVSASLAELHAGEPVTIGTPLPNYGLLVIATDVEAGRRLLPPGETGAAAADDPHGPVARAVLHVPLPHGQPGRLGAVRGGHVHPRVPVREGARVRHRHRGQVAHRRPVERGHVPHVGLRLLPLVGHRPARGGRAHLPDLLGDEEIDGGWMTMQPTVVSRRSFVGNGAYIHDGTTLPENVLVGVLSRAPEADRMQSGDTWLGSPAMHLPARETVAGFPESLTFRPSPWRRLARGLIEALRIVAPHAIVISAGYAIVLAVMPTAGAGRWGEVAWDLTIDGLWFGLATYVFVAAFKWMLIGRYRQRAVPMWTPFVWLSEATTNLYEGIAVPNFMRYLRGTPWLPWALNLLGCHIGRGVYLDTTDITEFDCVRIGDHTELNALTCPQTHLFEDRVMKIDEVRIGRQVNIGPRTTVLYSASVADNVQLGPMTLVMKGESLPQDTRWVGNPAAPANR